MINTLTWKKCAASDWIIDLIVTHSPISNPGVYQSNKCVAQMLCVWTRKLVECKYAFGHRMANTVCMHVNKPKRGEWKCVITISKPMETPSMEAEENRNLFLERNKNNRHERVRMRLSTEGHSPLRVSMFNTCKLASDAPSYPSIVPLAVAKPCKSDVAAKEGNMYECALSTEKLRLIIVQTKPLLRKCAQNEMLNCWRVPSIMMQAAKQCHVFKMIF